MRRAREAGHQLNVFPLEIRVNISYKTTFFTSKRDAAKTCAGKLGEEENVINKE